jgi:hypothetical protein
MEDIDISQFMAEDDTALEFDIGDFDMTCDVMPQETRYIKPKFSSQPIYVDYANAKTMAKKIQLYPGEQVHGIVKGDFIFGDFIEALLVEKQATCTEMHLSTLSMSQNNIDSLAGLMNDRYIKNLALVLSNYFYSHEKHVLIPYMLKEMDKDDRFDCRICRNHTKIVLMEISNLKLVLTGSSNLRSSQSIEQFVMQENEELYGFYKTWFDSLKEYSIINREVAK